MWATTAVWGTGPPTAQYGSPIVSTNGCQNRGNGSKWVWSELNIHHGNDMEKYGNNGEGCSNLMNEWKKWKFDKKCFWGYLHNIFIQWSKTLLPIVLVHGILLCMVFVHGFWAILILGVFGSFWREWGYVTMNAQLPCIYGEGIIMFWTIFGGI